MLKANERWETLDRPEVPQAKGRNDKGGKGVTPVENALGVPGSQTKEKVGKKSPGEFR